MCDDVVSLSNERLSVLDQRFCWWPDMHGFGFSLKWLLAVVTFAAVGLTALFTPSQVWESVIGLLTALFLLTTVVAAICSRGERRAF